jgi:hypothetical protein
MNRSTSAMGEGATGRYSIDYRRYDEWRTVPWTREALQILAWSVAGTRMLALLFRALAFSSSPHWGEDRGEGATLRQRLTKARFA